MASYKKYSSKRDAPEAHLYIRNDDPKEGRHLADIKKIDVDVNPNYMFTEDDSFKIALNIGYKPNPGDKTHKPSVVFGGRGDAPDGTTNRIKTVLPIRQYSKANEGYLTFELDPEKDAKMIEFLIGIKMKIHNKVKDSPQLVGRESLTDEEVDDMVRFSMFPKPSKPPSDKSDNLILRVKVRFKEFNGKVTPIVSHKRNKKKTYGLAEVKSLFCSESATGTRFDSKMTLFVELGNVYLNFLKDMDTGEFKRDDEGRLIPRLYPTMSLTRAIHDDLVERESTSIPVQTFEVDEFPLTGLVISEPITDNNDKKRAYMNLQNGEQLSKFEISIRNVPNLFGVSTSQTTGEPTHLSIPLEGDDQGTKLKAIMLTFQDAVAKAGVDYSFDFFRKKKCTDEFVRGKMTDDRGQINIYYPRKKDDEGDPTDEIDEDLAPLIKIKVATDPETGEYKFPVCYKDQPDTPLPHEEADRLLRTRGNKFDIVFRTKSLSYTSKFSLPLATYKILVYKEDSGFDEEDSDDDE